jgi:hypothetical protein
VFLGVAVIKVLNEFLPPFPYKLHASITINLNIQYSYLPSKNNKISTNILMKIEAAVYLRAR